MYAEDNLLKTLSLCMYVCMYVCMNECLCAEEKWLQFLSVQKKLSFASFSSIDYIDKRGNAKKHRVKKVHKHPREIPAHTYIHTYIHLNQELVQSDGFDAKKLSEMNKIKRELEKLGIVVT